MIADALATTSAPVSCQPVAVALCAILEELRAVLIDLEAPSYTARMGPLFSNSTIGGHVRHCLDHARSLVEGARSGVIDYDHRVRGTMIEADPAAALAELGMLIESTRRLVCRDAVEPVGVAIMPTRDGESITLASSLARELAFVLSHTIHHNATIRGMAAAAGHTVPDSFGYAPSTLAHMECCACVR